MESCVRVRVRVPGLAYPTLPFPTPVVTVRAAGEVRAASLGSTQA